MYIAGNNMAKKLCDITGGVNPDSPVAGPSDDVHLFVLHCVFQNRSNHVHKAEVVGIL